MFRIEKRKTDIKKRKIEDAKSLVYVSHVLICNGIKILKNYSNIISLLVYL